MTLGRDLDTLNGKTTRTVDSVEYIRKDQIKDYQIRSLSQFMGSNSNDAFTRILDFGVFIVGLKKRNIIVMVGASIV